MLLWRKRRRLPIVFGLTVLLFALYQLDRNSRIDDSPIGENLYFLLKDGVVRSELMRGYGGLSLEVHQTIYHKLFIYLAYPFVALTGWSLTSLHLFTLLCFAGLALTLWRGFGHLIPQFRPQDRLLYFCLFLINYNVLYFCGAFRPETLLTLLGLLQFISLRKHLQTSSAPWLLLAAVLGGSGLATHPHGAIFLVAGFLLLITQKRFKALPAYVVVSSACFVLIYFADIYLQGTFATFLYQATHDPIIQNQKKDWYSPLLHLADEATRLFFNEREIVATLLWVFSLFGGYRAIRRQNTPLLLYFLFSLGALGLISYSNSPQYLLLYTPYSIALIGMGWQSVRAGANQSKKYGLQLLMTAYVVVHLAFALFHISQNLHSRNQPGTVARNAAVARLLPQPHAQKALLAYDDFVFDEIKHFRRIQSLTMHSFFREMQGLPPITLSGLLETARRSGADFVILNPPYLARFGPADTALRTYRGNVTGPRLYHHSEACTIFRIR